MNKARAMLDALMGPQRDANNKEARKVQWRDKTMCKSFLVGFCPLDKSVLGGKLGLEPCGKLHSEAQRAAFSESEDGAQGSRFRWACEKNAYEDILYVISVRNEHSREEVQKEKDKISKQPKAAMLADEINAKIRGMHRERHQLVVQAKLLEGSDDPKEVAARERMMDEIIQLEKDATNYERDEYTKAMEESGPKACSVCGTMYRGKEEYNKHLDFKIHKAFEEVVARNDELKELMKKCPKDITIDSEDVKEKPKSKPAPRDVASDVAGAGKAEHRSRHEDGGRDRQGRGGRREDRSRQRGERRRSRSRRDRGQKSRSRGRGRKKSRSRDRNRGRNRKDSRERKLSNDRSRSPKKQSPSPAAKVPERGSPSRSPMPPPSPSPPPAPAEEKPREPSPPPEKTQPTKKAKDGQGATLAKAAKKAPLPDPLSPSSSDLSDSSDHPPKAKAETKPVVEEKPPEPKAIAPVKMKLTGWQPMCLRNIG